MDAELNIADTSVGRIVTVAQNVVHGTEELDHIDAIIEMIEHTLDRMYEEERRFEARLVPVPAT
jgi:hypothetical protein